MNWSHRPSRWWDQFTIFGNHRLRPFPFPFVPLPLWLLLSMLCCFYSALPSLCSAFSVVLCRLYSDHPLCGGIHQSGNGTKRKGNSQSQWLPDIVNWSHQRLGRWDQFTISGTTVGEGNKGEELVKLSLGSLDPNLKVTKHRREFSGQLYSGLQGNR